MSTESANSNCIAALFGYRIDSATLYQKHRINFTVHSKFFLKQSSVLVSLAAFRFVMKSVDVSDKFDEFIINESMDEV